MTAAEIAATMFKQDHFSKWLGLEIETVSAGFCRLHYRVRQDMLNGFASVHGGILFAAADSAFAFACNSHGVMAVALEASVNFVRPAKEGDELYVEAKEIYLGTKTGLYDIRTSDAAGNLVAAFRGTAYRTGKAFI